MTCDEAGVLDAEGLLHGNSCVHSRSAGSSTNMEAIQVLSERENTPGALAYHYVSGKHMSEDKRLVTAEKTVMVSQTIMKDSIAGIFWLVKDALTAWATFEGHNDIKRADNWPKVMFQGQVNKMMVEKLNFVEFKNHQFHKIEDGAPSTRQMTKMTEAMLENENIIALGANIVRK